MEKVNKIYLRYLKPFFVVLLFLLSVKFVFATNHIDSDGTASGFGGGTHINTQWDGGNNWLEMDATGMTNGFATYTSRILNAGFTGTWNTLSWVPNIPYLKELPNSGATESSYPNGNIDMSENFLLLHLNDSSGTITDSSGNGTNLTNSGASYSSLGKFNKGMLFQTSDYLYRTNAASLNPSNYITISAWFRVSADPSNYSTLVSKFASGYSGWHLALDNGVGNARFWMTTSNGNYVTTFSNNDISANRWHHLVGVYDGSSIKIYLNGVLKNSAVASGTISNTSGNLAIGRLYPTTNDYYFNGYLDEVALWSRALSSTEVLNLYKRGALTLQMQVRSCDDSNCTGENFVGQGGSTSNYYEEQDLNTASLPSFDVSESVSDNQYFQYRVVLQTASSTLSPEIHSVTVDGPTVGSFTVSPISGNTTEAGGTSTYTIVLDTAPTANVTIDVSSSDTTEGTVSPTTLTFTSENWNTPQTVTVTGVNDFLDDDDVSYTIINGAASSADGSFNSINPSDVTLTNTDNDTAGFTVSAISGDTTEAGGSATYTVVLTAQPTASVTINVSSSDTTEGTVSIESLVFTTENWNIPQTVTVTGVSDVIVDGDIAYNIVNSSAVSEDLNYNNLNPNDVSVTNIDSGVGEGGGGGGGEGEAAAVPEFSDFFGLVILGIGGIFIYSQIKKIQSVKN